MAVTFQILGPLEVHSSAGDVRIGGLRQQKLLAILLLNANRVVPVDRLVDELWDSPPRSVRQQVHNAVGSLRRTLANTTQAPRITRTDAGYRLDVPEESVDAHEFLSLVRDARKAEAIGDLTTAVAQLHSALGLWRGTALTGLYGAAIESVAASLNEKRLSTIEELMSLRLRAGEASSIIAELQQLVSEHPLRESLRGSLMHALHRSGRQADALAVYDDGRRILADDLGLDPSPRLREIHAAILTGETPDPPGPTRPDAGTGDEVRPSQPPEPRSTRSFLPHDTKDFSGRSDELLKLLTETNNALATTLVISALDGMGGVGKTSLAVHLAHQVAEDYPDGQYFINLHGFSSGMDPVTPAQALDALLRDSGVPPELIPSTVDGRSALWRSRMAGQRALVILDNATDAAHVRPLLPGTVGLLVVVTSRRKLGALDGVVPMSLDVFTREDAVSLFTKVAGAERTAQEPEAVIATVELCGRLPLAVRIAAARLRDRTSWTVADLVNRLKDHAQRTRFLQVDDRSVMAVLKLSYRYLPPRQKRLFRQLALHPGADFDAHAAAALTGLALDDAEFCLEALFDDNLLKQNTAGRFYFHDLVRDCARQLLTDTESEDEQRTALQRLLDYYLHAAYTWCRDLDNGIYHMKPQVALVPHAVKVPRGSQDALEILHTEIGNLAAVARVASEHGRHRHGWQLACVLQPFLRSLNYGGPSFEMFYSGARAARASGDLLGESACLHGLAIVCRERRSNTEAREHLQHALELSRQIGDQNIEVAQLIDMGTLYGNDERLKEAREAFRAADALTTMTTSNMLRAAITNNLGVISRDLGHFDEALNHLKVAIRTAEHEESSRPKLLTAWSIGTVLHLQGKHRDALEQFEQILHTSITDKFHHGEALALLGLCGAHRALGNLTQSLDTGRRALTLARQFELRKVECEVLCSLGEATFASKDTHRAKYVFEQTKERAENYSLTRYEARALEGLAHVSRVHGRRHDAQQQWQQAIEIYPAGMVDAEYARRHITLLEDNTTSCFRCAIGEQV